MLGCALIPKPSGFNLRIESLVIESKILTFHSLKLWRSFNLRIESLVIERSHRFPPTALVFLVSISELRVLLLRDSKLGVAGRHFELVSISELRVLLLRAQQRWCFGHFTEIVSISELRVLLLRDSEAHALRVRIASFNLRIESLVIESQPLTSPLNPSA